MAIGVYFSNFSMTADRYREVLKQLEAAGLGKPKGRKYHAIFGDTNDLMVFDVWESQAEFDAFGAVLMPIHEKAGVAATQPDIMPIHNIITP